MSQRTVSVEDGNIPSSKACSRCAIAKPIVDFYAHTSKKDGKTRFCSWCKVCRLASNKRRYREDAERRIKGARCWRDAHPERLAQYAKTWRDRTRTDIGLWFKAGIGFRRRRAKQKGVPFDLTWLDLVDLYQQQGGLCALTGRRLEFGHWDFRRDTLTVDRVIPALGYTRDNVRLVTFQANFAKNKFSDDDLISLAKAILKTHRAKEKQSG